VSKTKLFIVSAPSGAGKTSLARALIAGASDVVMSISHTTRARRSGETDGVDYHFVSDSEFIDMISEGLFLEHALVYGNYYGTSKKAVQDLLDQGKHVLLDIDWQGARSIRMVMPEAISISILPPSVEELERRLRARGSDSDDVIKSRMAQALDEMSHCSEADFLVLNDDFNAALQDLTLIVSDQGDRIRPLTAEVAKLAG
jgi:guanylate kinase